MTRNPRSKVFAFVVLVVATLGVLVLCLPTIVTRLGLGRRAVATALKEAGLGGRCQSISIGWRQPLQIRKLSVTSAVGEQLCEIETLDTSISIMRLLRGEQDLGTLEVAGSSLHLYLGKGSDAWKSLDREPRSESDESAGEQIKKDWKLVLRDSEVVVHEHTSSDLLTKVPVKELAVSVATHSDGRWLVVDLAEPVSRVPLTPELCEVGLKYIAPVFAAATWTEGTVSFQMDECQVPLGQPELASLRGKLTLHDVSAGLKSPVVKEITETLGTVLAKKVPESLRVAEESFVEFQVADRRVHHEGLAIGLPDVSKDIVFQSRGSVGLDETLDMEVELPLPLGMFRNFKLAQSIGNRRITVPIKGTLEKPQVSFAGDGQLLGGLLGDLGDQLEGPDELNADKQDRENQDADGKPEGPQQPEVDVADVIGEAVDVVEEIRQRMQQRRAESDPSEGRRQPLRGLLRRRREGSAEAPGEP